jgi:hypothetical protein
MILFGAGLLSLGAVAFAQSPAAPPGGRFAAPPADRTELKAQLEKRFDAIDANKDGTITPEERKAQRTAMRGQMRERMFARLDADKNGVISKDEFTAPRQRPDGAGKREGRKGDHGPMAGGMMRHQFAGHHDQPITKTAFVDAGLGRFDRVDTDHDGRISPAERDAARKAMRDRLAPAGKPTPPPPGQ